MEFDGEKQMVRFEICAQYYADYEQVNMPVISHKHSKKPDYILCGA